MDVQEIRSPEMRMKVAKLGGNALLILPGRHPTKVTPAAVYDCPKLAVKTPVGVTPAPPPPKR